MRRTLLRRRRLAPATGLASVIAQLAGSELVGHTLSRSLECTQAPTRLVGRACIPPAGPKRGKLLRRSLWVGQREHRKHCIASRKPFSVAAPRISADDRQHGERTSSQRRHSYLFSVVAKAPERLERAGRFCGRLAPGPGNARLAGNFKGHRRVPSGPRHAPPRQRIFQSGQR